MVDVVEGGLALLTVARWRNATLSNFSMFDSAFDDKHRQSSIIDHPRFNHVLNFIMPFYNLSKYALLRRFIYL